MRKGQNLLRIKKEESMDFSFLLGSYRSRVLLEMAIVRRVKCYSKGGFPIKESNVLSLNTF
jgi:hypothetical protein